MQDKEKHEIDDVFRRGMSQLTEEAPSVSGWNSLRSEMASEGIKITTVKTFGKLIQFSIASVVVVTTGLSIYFYSHKNKEEEKNPSTAIATAIIAESATSAVNTTQQELTINTDIQIAATVSENATAINTKAALKKNKHESADNKKSEIVPASENIKTSTNISGSNKKHRSKNKATSTKNKSATILATSSIHDESIEEEKENANILTSKNESLSSSTDNSDKVTANVSEENSTTNNVDSSTTEASDNTNDAIALITSDTKVDSLVTSEETSADLAVLADSATTIAHLDSACIAEEHIIIPPDTSKKFSIGVYVSLDRNYYTLKPGNTDLVGGVSDFNDSIKGEPSLNQYTIGITGAYKTGKKISIETGLFYSQKKKIYYNSPTYHVITSPDDSLGWSDNKFEYHHNAQYIQLSVKVKMNVVDKEKFRFFVASGMVFESNIPASKDKQSYYQFEANTYDKNTIQKYTFEPGSFGSNLIISTGIDYKLKDNWILSFEPSYIYGFKQVIRYKGDETVSPVKHYNRSVCFGIRLAKEF